MNTTRRQLLHTAAASSLAALAAGSGRNANGQAGARKQRVLAILGDAYHAVAPLDAALAGRLRKADCSCITTASATTRKAGPFPAWRKPTSSATPPS